MKLKLLKIKTKILTFLGKCIGIFNANIKGIGVNYNVRYGKEKLQTLDVMYPKTQQEKSLPCVIYLHGGGWSCYDKSLFRSTCKTICKCGAVVFNCNYRLAPQNTVSDMLVDLMQIVKYLQHNAKLYNIDSNKIVLAGDSSGAHLVSLFNALLHYCNDNLNEEIDKNIIANEFSANYCKLLDENFSVKNNIAGLVLFYGAYDLTTIQESGFKHINVYVKSLICDKYDSKTYLQRISPIFYCNPNFAPTLLFSGRVDKLHNSQSQKYYERLVEINAEVNCNFYDKTNKKAHHKFITFYKNPISKKAIAIVNNFLQKLNKQ